VPPGNAGFDRDMMRRCIEMRRVRPGRRIPLRRRDNAGGESCRRVDQPRRARTQCHPSRRSGVDLAHAKDTRHRQPQRLRAVYDLGTVRLLRLCHRESRLGRVIYALHSPYMGGALRWNVLTDQDLSEKMPEVLDPPPEVVAGLMAQETEDALLEWNPLVLGFCQTARPLRHRSARTFHRAITDENFDADRAAAHAAAALVGVRSVWTPSVIAEQT